MHFFMYEAQETRHNAFVTCKARSLRGQDKQQQTKKIHNEHKQQHRIRRR